MANQLRAPVVDLSRSIIQSRKVKRIPDGFREQRDKSNVTGDRALYFEDHRPDPEQNVNWLQSANVNVPESTQANWSLNRMPILVTDVVQGDSNNCWYLAAYAALVHRRPQDALTMVSRLVDPDKTVDNENRKFKHYVQLYEQGKPVTIVVSDDLPCDDNGELIYATSPGKQLAVPLVEKGVALMHWCYEVLDTGAPREGFSTLTPHPYRQIYLDSDADDLWHELWQCQASRYPMVAATEYFKDDDQKNKERYKRMGLVTNHCYTLLELVVINGARLVQLYNLWGKFSWNGDWSDESNRWTPDLKLHYKANQGSKGIFHMPFDAFCKYFRHVDVCLIKNGWFVTRFDHKLPRDGSDVNNMSVFQITVENDSTEVEVMVNQESRRSKRNYLTPALPICVCIYEESSGELIYFSGYISDIHRRCALTLNTGSYLVVPMAFNHFPKPPVVLTSPETVRFEAPPNQPLQHLVTCFYSNKKIKVYGCGSDTALIGDALFSLLLARGNPVQVHENANVEMYMMELPEGWTGMVVAIVNKDHKHSFEFTLDGNGCENIVSTRGCLEKANDLKTVDTIEPRTWQLIAVLSPGSPDEPLNVECDCECVQLDGHVKAKHDPALGQALPIHRPRPLPPQ